MKNYSTIISVLCALLLFNISFAQKKPKISLGHTGQVKEIYPLKDGKYILSIGMKRAILWDANSGKELNDLFKTDDQAESMLVYFAFDEKTNTLIRAHGDGGTLPDTWTITKKVLFQPGSEKTFTIKKAQIGEYATIQRLTMVPGGNHLIISPTVNKLIKMNLNNGDLQPIEFGKAGASPQKLAVHPNGKEVAGLYYATEFKKGAVKWYEKAAIIDLDRGKTKTDVVLTEFESDELIHYMQASLDYSPSGDQIIISYAKHIGIYNAQNLSLQRRMESLPAPAYSINYNKDGTMIAVGTGDLNNIMKNEYSGIHLYELSSGKLIQSMMDYDYPVTALDFLIDGGELLGADYTGIIKRWDVQTGLLVQSFSGDAGMPGTGFSKLFPDGRSVLSVVTDGMIRWDVASSRVLQEYPVKKGATILAIDISEDGNQVAAGTMTGDMMIFDAKSGRKTHQFGETASESTPNTEKYQYMVNDIEFITNTSRIAYRKKMKIEVYDVNTNQIVFSKPSIATAFATNPQGTRLAAHSGSYTDYELAVFDVRSGSKVLGIKEVGASATDMLFINNGKTLVVGGMNQNAEWAVTLFDANNGNLIKTIRSFSGVPKLTKHPAENGFLLLNLNGSEFTWYDNSGNEIRRFKGNPGNTVEAQFYHDGDVVFSSGGDKTTKFWDVETGDLLFTKVFFSSESSNDWVAYTPEGRFDGTENGINNLYFLDDLTIVPLESMYEQFYTPNLTARLIGGENLEEVVASVDDLTPAPLVQITSPGTGVTASQKEITVEVSATDQGGGVDEIRLYLNGKLIENDQRGFKQLGNTQSFNVSLTGNTNRIKAVALNSQRTESLPDEITVIYEGASKKADLYMLVVGANEYMNPKYNLNYAKADATAFKTTIETNAGSIYNSVNILEISDKDFTRGKLLETFENLKATTSGEDVFIFYYAGHGVMSEESRSQFYIVPHDVTQLYGNNELLRKKAVSAKELQQFSTELKAQKQLFVLDACQAGGMTELLASRGAAEEKAIAQLARSTGTFWLTASGSEQFATEFEQLGHGVFTYAILNGLKGEADGGKRDQKITVKELSAYLNDRVPELSAQHKGEAQFPTSYGYGQDFPIVITK